MTKFVCLATGLLALGSLAQGAAAQDSLDLGTPQLRQFAAGNPGLAAPPSASQATVLNYFTPSLGGQLSGAALAGSRGTPERGQASDYGVGLNYQQSFANFSVQALTGVTASRGDPTSGGMMTGGSGITPFGPQSDTALSWGGGLAMEFGPFRVGGTYQKARPENLTLTDAGQPRDPADDLTGFKIGGSYISGPLSLSLGVVQGYPDGGTLGAAASLNNGSAPVMTEYQLGARYAVGSAFSLGAGIDYSASGTGGNAGTTARDLHGLSLRMGSTLRF